MNIYTTNSKHNNYTVYTPALSVDSDAEIKTTTYNEIDIALKDKQEDYTTYPCDCSTDDGACINIRPNCINIQFYQPVANPVLTDIIEDIENLQSSTFENKAEINSLGQAHLIFVNETEQNFANVKSDINKIYVNEESLNQANQNLNTKVDDLVEEFNRINGFVSEEDLENALLNYASKTYVDEQIASVDVSEQLKDYATKTYVDEEISKIDVSEQLENYVDKDTLEESEMATAQLFAIINDDILYKADKSEFMYYSTLNYVDNKDAKINTYIDKEFLKISEYEKNTEETNLVLAQTIATLNERIDNAVNVDMSTYYDKTEIDALINDIPTFDPVNYYDKTYINSNYYTSSKIDELIETATGVDFSNYYTKTETDSAISTAISQLDYVDETELQNALSTKITVWSGTQAEYDALTEKDDKIMYMIYE